MIRLSIIIPTYVNKRFSVDRLLLSLQGYYVQLNIHESCEVIVVDDGSDVDISECIKRTFPNWKGLRIIRKEHSGLCSTLNMGVKEARGEWLLIGVDDDVPRYDAIEIILDYLNKNRNYKDVAIGDEPFLNHATGLKNLFSTQCFRGINTVEYFERYKSELEIFPNISLDDIEKRYDELLSISTEIEVNKQFPTFISNANMREDHWLCIRPGTLIISKRFYDEIGGFDEKLDCSGWYSDLDIGYRIFKGGGSIAFLSNVIFIHLNHIRIFAVPNEEDRCYRVLLEKYPNDLKIMLLPLLWNNSNLVQYCKNVQRVINYFDLKEKEYSRYI